MDQKENFTSEDEEIQPTNENIPAKNTLKDVLRLLFFAGIIIGLDQWTKYLVVTKIPFLETWLPEKLQSWGSFVQIVHWHNSGAAFGIFQSGNLVIMVLAIVASGFIIYYFPQIEKSEWSIRLAMIFQLAGALGNLIDRFQYGYVVDFIAVMDFPVFNIADASISIGVAILILGILIQEIKDHKKQEDQNNKEGNTQLEESNL